MSEILDKALKHLSIEEEDEPFVLPDRPEFYATERNSMSLIGRLLNPHCQKMGDLILDMPRKWQLYNRVRGVALSKERFQFIFKHEHDLIDILNRGVHTFENWSIVLDRWMEKPPEDYLKFIMVWVQMRNIPVNHYTPETIEALGEFAGHVVEVPFDPEKAQVKHYVRVQRCYTCQRLTHEQSMCPWRKVDKEATVGVSCSSGESKNTEVLNLLEESDPLFGVLSSKHLGLEPVSGRPKIAKEVMDGMRQYLQVDEGPEKMARVERVKKSLEDLENDPLGQKVFLRLESAPILSSSLDKGKGAVFDFSSQAEPQPRQEKLMASAIAAGSKILQSGKVVSPDPAAKEYEVYAQSGFLVQGSTGYSVGISDTSISGTLLKKPKQRKRPGTYSRKATGKRVVKAEAGGIVRVGEGVISDGKRKAHDDVEPSKSSARFKKPLVVPSEGPSNI
ncbi:uncharacterized protein LOC125583238 [Brassica napus]|uniref:uncharacterized protein LOC125583238 n=1 Tax=Brassica napus TaxID=3708 RepID=UPI00207990CA|nr:uncharacterized protein LOC125583238 [Brassica napus]